MGRSGPQTGLVIIRVWKEDVPEGRVRARIISLLDLEQLNETVSAAGSAEDIQTRVKEWLEEFVSSEDRRPR